MARCKVLFLAFGLVLTASFRIQADDTDSEKLIKELEIIYLKPARRSPHDRVTIDGATATIRVWRELPPNPISDRVECGAYHWLLTGRGEKMGHGAREVFKKFQNLNLLKLELVENETKAESVDKRGKLKKVLIAKPYLEISIDRGRAARIPENTQEVRKLIDKDTAACVNWGRALVATHEVKL